MVGDWIWGCFELDGDLMGGGGGGEGDCNEVWVF